MTASEAEAIARRMRRGSLLVGHSLVDSWPGCWGNGQSLRGDTDLTATCTAVVKLMMETVEAMTGSAATVGLSRTGAAAGRAEGVEGAGDEAVDIGAAVAGKGLVMAKTSVLGCSHTGTALRRCRPAPESRSFRALLMTKGTNGHLEMGHTRPAVLLLPSWARAREYVDCLTWFV